MRESSVKGLEDYFFQKPHRAGRWHRGSNVLLCNRTSHPEYFDRTGEAVTLDRMACSLHWEERSLDATAREAFLACLALWCHGCRCLARWETRPIMRISCRSDEGSEVFDYLWRDTSARQISDSLPPRSQLTVWTAEEDCLASLPLLRGTNCAGALGMTSLEEEFPGVPGEVTKSIRVLADSISSSPKPALRRRHLRATNIRFLSEKSCTPVIEVFHLPRVVPEIISRGYGSIPEHEGTMDRSTGWRLLGGEGDRGEVLRRLNLLKPVVAVLCPDAGDLKGLSECSWGSLQADMDRCVLKVRESQMRLAVEVARRQVQEGRHFLLERESDSWGGVDPGGLEGCPTVQCAVVSGQSHVSRWYTSDDPGLLSALPRSGASQRSLVKSLADGVEEAVWRASQGSGSFPAQLPQPLPEHPAGVGAEEDVEEVNEGDFESDDDVEVDETREPTEEEKAELLKVHINCGHPPLPEYLRMLKVAGAKPHLIHWAKHNFRCAQCEASQRPKWRRRAAMPRTYHFNRLVAVDLFYIGFHGNSVPVLNILDHGTGYQLCELLPGQSAAQAWRAFERCWLRYFGPPEILLCDGGGEFEEAFARACEHHGVFIHVCDANSPWQNGRCERHGGWIKESMEKAGQDLDLRSLAELDELLCQTVSAKNRFFHRGGFSPYQLVFGENPAFPGASCRMKP